jgi:hypothetical protein
MTEDQGSRTALVLDERHATWHARRCRRIAHLMSITHPVRAARLAALSALVGRRVDSTLDLTWDEARTVLLAVATPDSPERAGVTRSGGAS